MAGQITTPLIHTSAVMADIANWKMAIEIVDKIPLKVVISYNTQRLQVEDSGNVGKSSLNLDFWKRGLDPYKQATKEEAR